MLAPFFKSKFLEAGTDEAGRGCLAGPVVGAAVVLFKKERKLYKKKGVSDTATFLSLINDSKQLSEKVRFELKPIIEKIAVSFAISFQDATIIDDINILNASLQSMRESILALQVVPIYIIVDGNQPLTPTAPVNIGEIRTGVFNEIPYSCLIKGDSKFMTIAAASILAKTYRDLYMDRIHEEFPMYNWKKNKGYATKEHREAIRTYGVTKYHRHSFRWLPEMSNEDFLKRKDERGERREERGERRDER